MKNVINLKDRVNNINTPEDLVTIKEFATSEGCSVSYLYKLRDRKKLKLYPRGYLKVSISEAKRAMEKEKNTGV